MRIGSKLVNWTRREYLILPDDTGVPQDSLPQVLNRESLVTTYLCTHAGDWIAFMEHAQSLWPFPTGSLSELQSYTDVTASVIAALIHEDDHRENQPTYREDDQPTSVYIRRQQHDHAAPAAPERTQLPAGPFYLPPHSEITYRIYQPAQRMGIRLETTDYGATWQLSFDQPWRSRPLFSQISYDPRDEPPPAYWARREALIATYPNLRDPLIDVERPGQSWWTVVLPAATVAPLTDYLESLVLPLFAWNEVLAETGHELTLQRRASTHRLRWQGFHLPAGWAGVASIIQTLKDLVYAQLPAMGHDPDPSTERAE